jgi:hypothetical protein
MGRRDKWRHGDRAKIQPELEKLGLGPVEVRDVNGQTAAGKP